MERIVRLIAILTCFALTAEAQFQGGFLTGTQAGVMGVTLNPANTNYLNNGTDFLLAGFSTSVLNNGFYLQPKPITQYVNGDIVRSLTKKDEGNPQESINQKFDRIFDLKRDLKDNNYIFADATIQGPSILINHHKHSFGLLTSLRNNSNTVRLSPEMAILMLKGANATELIGQNMSLNFVSSNTMVTSDIAFNYSYQIVNNYKSIQRLGFTAHYLSGIASVVFQANNDALWQFVGDSTIYANPTDLYYGYSATKSEKAGDLFESRGKGFAFDIGYTYVRKKKSRPTRLTVCPNIRFLGRIREYQEYKWKFGAAIMDIGYMNFNYQTSFNTYENATGGLKNLDQEFYRGVFALERALYFGLSGPGTEYKNEKAFTQALPTRLNVQFDYQYKNNLYFNFAATHRLPLPGTVAMKAVNVMSFTTRFEREKYDLYMPINLIEYQIPTLGFGFRTGPFYMGTNHLLEMVGLRKIKGVDLFFGLKFNLSNFRGV